MAVCYDGYYNYNGYCRTTWDVWARWLVLGLVIAAALIIFFLFSCISARRRRRMGTNPLPGTAWTLGRTPPGHAPATYTGGQGYYGQQQQQQQPYYGNPDNINGGGPPAYTPPPNNGYYGNDVELQQPGATYGGYRNNESAYEPPKGPPPGRS